MARFLANRDGGKTDEEGLYKFLDQLFSGAALENNALKVTQQDVVAMGIKVATGGIKIPSGNDYPYVCWQDATQNLAISAADATNPRRDLVVAYVDLGEVDDSSPNNPDAFKLAVVAGTPAASPSDPNESAIDAVIGASNPYVTLARVRVAAGATSITNAVIDDLRTKAQLDGISLFGAGTSMLGTTPTLTMGKFYIQAGSTVGTFASSALDITFPTPFPNGVLSVTVTNGDNSGGEGMSISNGNVTLSSFRAQSPSNGLKRVNWIAIGY